MRKLNSTNALNEQWLNSSCGMAYTLSVIGGRWKAAILHQLLRGKLRYKELKELLPNISERMLSLQLRELESDGIITREVYAEVPPKVEYFLSEKGWSMQPILEMMSNWGQENMEINNKQKQSL
jgi:DNA-binding HxlR family transcriptional regulator